MNLEKRGYEKGSVYMLKRIKYIIGRADQKLNDRISTQLIISFIGMFLIIIAVSATFIYAGVLNMLKNNSEKNNVTKFKQYEYNINTFCSSVDFISRQLVFDAHLQDLLSYKTMADSERVVLMTEVFEQMSQVLWDYKYIDSIVFYSGKDLCLRATSQKNEILNANLDKDKFYHKEFSGSLRNRMFKMAWFGGYSNKDFGIEAENNPAANHYYLTAARDIYSDGVYGIIVLNINMKYFTSIYSHSSDVKTDEMYMINRAGLVISHPDEAMIMKSKETYQMMDSNRKIQVFAVRGRDRNQKQAVYYSLGIADWILVSEVPMAVIKKDISYLKYIISLMLIVSIVIAGFISKFWIDKITKPLNQVIKAMRKMEQGNLGVVMETSSRNELGLLAGQFNKMSRSIEELISENSKMEAQKRKIEMAALRSQINPHFIYNTLNTIKWMASLRKADNIVVCLTTLTEFLQPIFRKKDIMCSVREEMEYISNYVKIMNYRYANAYQLRLDVDETLLDCQILRFILQPLVENAINHGFVNLNQGEISVKICLDVQNIVINVRDNGNGITEEKLSILTQSLRTTNGFVSEDEMDLNQEGEVHIGLMNVHRRIQLHFGQAYGLLINMGLEAGTEVSVVMPSVHKS